MYLHLPSSIDVDMAVFVNGLSEKASSHNGTLKRAKGLDYSDVDQSILQARVRRDKGIVAILRRISARHHKHIFFNHLVITIVVTFIALLAAAYFVLKAVTAKGSL